MTNKPLAIITGGAGFIGSNMADRLLAEGYRVKVVDNLKAGKKEFIEHNLDKTDFEFVKLDLCEAERLVEEFKGAELVCHYAANADVKGGRDHPTVDLQEGCINTSNVLEAMRANNIKKMIFSSTGSIYGEPEVFPTPEDAPFPIQTSMYAAAKCYAEGLISAYCEAYEMQAWIFRFVSIMGERYTHGLIFDFYKQLQEHPDHLNFLSDGTPLKSYLYIGDCVEAMYTALTKADGKVNIFNLGTDEARKVTEMAQCLIDYLGLTGVELRLGKQPRGWIGDSPHIHLDTKKIRGLGWKPQLTIFEAVQKTADYLKANQWTLGEKYFREK